MEALRPLDDLIHQYSGGCVLSQEPQEHGHFLSPMGVRVSMCCLCVVLKLCYRVLTVTLPAKTWNFSNHLENLEKAWNFATDIKNLEKNTNFVSLTLKAWKFILMTILGTLFHHHTLVTFILFCRGHSTGTYLYTYYKLKPTLKIAIWT